MRNLTTKVDDNLYDRFKSICERKGTNINAYLKKVVEEVLSTGEVKKSISDDKSELAGVIPKLLERRRNLECELINNGIALDELVNTFIKLSK